MAAVVYGLISGADAGWTATRTLVALSAGLVLLAVFVLVEHRSRYPLMPLRTATTTPLLAHATSGTARLAALTSGYQAGFAASATFAAIAALVTVLTVPSDRKQGG
jgi:hypothetical protein